METSPQTSSDLIRDVLAGRLDVGAMVDRLSDDEVVAWANGGGGVAMLRLRLMCEIGRTHAMAVSHQFAATAVHRLLTIVADHEADVETVRRACAEMLKLLDHGSSGGAAPAVRINRVELMQQIVAKSRPEVKEAS